jgi:hypothetical protein
MPLKAAMQRPDAPAKVGMRVPTVICTRIALWFSETCTSVIRSVLSVCHMTTVTSWRTAISLRWGSTSLTSEARSSAP